MCRGTRRRARPFRVFVFAGAAPAANALRRLPGRAGGGGGGRAIARSRLFGPSSEPPRRPSRSGSSRRWSTSLSSSPRRETCPTSASLRLLLWRGSAQPFPGAFPEVSHRPPSAASLCRGARLAHAAGACAASGWRTRPRPFSDPSRSPLGAFDRRATCGWRPLPRRRFCTTTGKIRCCCRRQPPGDS